VVQPLGKLTMLAVVIKGPDLVVVVQRFRRSAGPEVGLPFTPPESSVTKLARRVKAEFGFTAHAAAAGPTRPWFSA
jgi:hypothetical protein